MKTHEPLLRAYLRRRVRRREDIEDYIQEVYARVLETPPRARVSNWQGLLRRIASNLLIDRSRRSSARCEHTHSSIEAHLEHADEKPTAEDMLLAKQQLVIATDVLQEVSPVARSIFLLVRVDGLSYKAAADRLGVDVKSAYRHVERIMILISRRLAEKV